MEKIETDKDLQSGHESGEAVRVRKQLTEIKLYKDQFKDWLDTCKRIGKRYRDEQADKHKGRFNIYWSNIENQKPSIFFQSPRPEIQRRNKDRSEVSRLASEMWERNTGYVIDCFDFESPANRARDEFLMYSRGQMRVRYSVDLVDVDKEVMDPFTGKVQVVQSRIKKPGTEKVYAEFVHREDYSHTPGVRTWEEVTWQCYDAYMTRSELIERFGEEKGSQVDLTYSPYENKEDEEFDASMYKKALVHEVWDKRTKTVFWISPGYKKDILDEEEDPLKIEGFFCSPKPAYMCIDTDSLVPIPEFIQVESLTMELDEVGRRKAALTRALKVAGIYDAACEEIAELKNTSPDLDLIPSKHFKAIIDKGGINSMIQFMPIEQTANVLRSMIEVEANIKQQLYEISGQSDIIRGATDPRETARAQSLKSQYANQRTQSKQKRFSSFIRDTVKIMAEVIIEHFDPETIAKIADIEAMGQKQMMLFPEAYKLLQDDTLRNYRIDIETDSTLASEGHEEKEQAVEFFNVLTQGLNDALPIMQARPETAKVLTEGLMMVARRFKIGRGFEDALDDFAEALTNPQQAMPPQPGMEQGAPQEGAPQEQQPPQIDPRIVTSQNESEARMAQLQQEGAIKQEQMNLDYQKHLDKMAIEQGKLGLKAEELKVREAREIGRQGGFTI